MINYKEVVMKGILKDILGSDCPSEWGLEDGMSEQECERDSSCYKGNYDYWYSLYRSLELNKDGYRR